MGNQRGQTSVEYILMIAAIVAIMSSVFTVVKNRFVGPGNCPSPDASLMCRMTALWRSEDPRVFKFFPLPLDN